MKLQEYLADLEYLVNIDRCSDDPEGLNRVAEFFSTRLATNTRFSPCRGITSATVPRQTMSA